MTGPDFLLEETFHAEGFRRIAGLDEVGRGPWAGPVTAAAVVLDPDAIPPGLNDSKRLGRAVRQRLSEEIWASADVGIGEASVDEIDRVNILQASHLAMQRAVAALEDPPDFALIDGRLLPRLDCPAQPLIGGDGRSLSIAAASIVAKVRRDRAMVALAQQHPGYGWETNVGYGTPAHRDALERLGITPHHRRSFRPIHKMLYQQN